MTEGDYSDSDLWEDMKYFDEESDKDEHTPLHEAGHLSVFEHLTKIRAMYGWTENEGVVCPCVWLPWHKVKCTPVTNIMVLMAGDITSMVQLGMDVPETSLALYRHYNPSGSCDWNKVRTLCPSEELMLDVAKSLGEIISGFWDVFVAEYRTASLFFDMFNHIPQVVELIDKDDRPTLEKFFGKRRGYGQVRKRLLDPNTAWEFCKHPNRDS